MRFVIYRYDPEGGEEPRMQPFELAEIERANDQITDFDAGFTGPARILLQDSALCRAVEPRAGLYRFDRAANLPQNVDQGST